MHLQSLTYWTQHNAYIEHTKLTVNVPNIMMGNGFLNLRALNTSSCVYSATGKKKCVAATASLMF